jgi:dihydrofolate synthase/folylpolyglutamate synthase
MLVASGYRTGLYTSPHLEDVRERLRLDGRAVARGTLERRLRRVVDAAQEACGEWPTYFEALTAVAFDLFADEAEIAVLEVGLGGRLDATNCGQPTVSLITEIGIDHTELLGASEIEIAGEKAGVMRDGRPVLAAATVDAVRECLRRRAEAVGARWHDVTAQVRWRERSAGVVDFETPEAAYRLAVPLAGAHQRRNLALAVRAAEVLREEGWERLTAAAIGRGAERSRWPGRLERVDLPTGHEVVLDAAHNPQGAAILAAALAASGGSYRLLFGALADKDARRSLGLLAEGATDVVLTTPPSSRAVAPETLMESLRGPRTAIVADPGRALTRALAGEACRLVVCGSIYLGGDVRRRLRRRFGIPPPAVEVAVA